MIVELIADDELKEENETADKRQIREEMSLLGVLNNYNRGNYKLNPVGIYLFFNFYLFFYSTFSLTSVKASKKKQGSRELKTESKKKKQNKFSDISQKGVFISGGREYLWLCYFTHLELRERPQLCCYKKFINIGKFRGRFREEVSFFVWLSFKMCSWFLG